MKRRDSRRFLIFALLAPQSSALSLLSASKAVLRLRGGEQSPGNWWRKGDLPAPLEGKPAINLREVVPLLLLLTALTPPLEGWLAKQHKLLGKVTSNFLRVLPVLLLLTAPTALYDELLGKKFVGKHVGKALLASPLLLKQFISWPRDLRTVLLQRLWQSRTSGKEDIPPLAKENPWPDSSWPGENFWGDLETTPSRDGEDNGGPLYLPAPGKELTNVDEVVTQMCATMSSLIYDANRGENADNGPGKALFYRTIEEQAQPNFDSKLKQHLEKPTWSVQRILSPSNWVSRFLGTANFQIFCRGPALDENFRIFDDHGPLKQMMPPMATAVLGDTMIIAWRGSVRNLSPRPRSRATPPKPAHLSTARRPPPHKPSPCSSDPDSNPITLTVPTRTGNNRGLDGQPQCRAHSPKPRLWELEGPQDSLGARHRVEKGPRRDVQAALLYCGAVWLRGLHEEAAQPE